MNKQKIQDAINILTATINSTDEMFDLRVILTKREVEVLRDICRTSSSVPEAVHRYTPTTGESEVLALLDKLRCATHCTR